MGQITRPNVYVDGTIIYAADVNDNETTIYSEFNGNIDNSNIKTTAAIAETKIDDISGTVAAMQTASDPGDDGSEVQANSLAVELKQLRFEVRAIKQAFDSTINYWYSDFSAGSVDQDITITKSTPIISLIDPSGPSTFLFLTDGTDSVISASLGSIGIRINSLFVANFPNPVGGPVRILLGNSSADVGLDVLGSIRACGGLSDDGLEISDNGVDSFISPAALRGTGRLLINSPDTTLQGAITMEEDGEVRIQAQTTPGCKVYRTTVMTGLSGSNAEPPSVTWTTVPFDAEEYDPDDMHSTVSNTSRITVPVVGKYLFTALFSRMSTSGGPGGGLAAEEVRIRFLVNGVTAKTHGGLLTGNSGSTPLCHSEEITLVAGDYVEVQVSARGDQNTTNDKVMYSPAAYVVCSARRVG